MYYSAVCNPVICRSLNSKNHKSKTALFEAIMLTNTSQSLISVRPGEENTASGHGQIMLYLV